MAAQNNSKITTIKMRKETKERLDHLKEFERETYDEIIKKILYILNMVRGTPENARRVLRKIDFKIKRKLPVYYNIPEDREEPVKEKNNLISKQNKLQR